MRSLTVATRQRCELVDLTREVQAAVDELGLRDGAVVVFVPHTTAGVTINENADPDVGHDLLKGLEEIIPHQTGFYRHIEGNSDAHIKASLVGSSVTVLVEGGRLQLGRWQGIYFCEFDGPRRRQVWIQTMAH